MQPTINLFYQSTLYMAIFIFILAVIIFRVIGARRQRLYKEYYEASTCKDGILKEFKKIRHDYNNMLQGLVGMIEEEDWEGLAEYKSRMLEKAHQHNNNNLTQLMRIKNNSILIIIYKLLTEAQKSDVSMILKIYSDIEDLQLNLNNRKLLKALPAYLYHAYETAAIGSGTVHLKISANQQGLRFAFESEAGSEAHHEKAATHRGKLPPSIYKNIFFNTIVQNDHLIQEILITI